MELSNGTRKTEFVILGLSNLPEYQAILFVAFLALYMTNIGGNSMVILLTRLDTSLHTPMYFFLGNLSFVDMCFTSSIVPLMLKNIVSLNKVMSLHACIAQLYFFLTFACTESFLLGCMAYDRYVAICNPLHYMMLMNQRACFLLVLFSWIICALRAMLHSFMAAKLSYCGANIIHNFFCELPHLLILSCSDTTANKMLMYTEGGLALAFPFIIVMVSYTRIISTILKIRSTQSRRNVFSTCSSHFTCVILFYGSICFIYLHPSSSYSTAYNRIVSIVYTVVAPTLNPFIYSLRNKDMNSALRKVLSKKGEI
ncbi:olfactory receptor 1468-like [Ambystoma mexicanum]|uniref:olfactory receptor 1468-like n=1 Tax=Ambystoma mexicanum TaxID=8296 RepID=UPI0037E7A275